MIQKGTSYFFSNLIQENSFNIMWYLMVRYRFAWYVLSNINKNATSVPVSIIVALFLQSILLLCLVLAEKPKPCLQFSLPKFLLSFLVSQIFLLKIKPFKKSRRLLANIQVPSLFKCNPSFHKHSLVMLSLLMK